MTTPAVPNNLHRELAPITPEAWAEIEEEARRTFRRLVAGRRVVDVPDPAGPELAAAGTGHLADIASPAPGVTARLREAKPLIELRVPFTVTRAAVDDVERGSSDSDWQPVKDAARAIAFAEDRTVFDGTRRRASKGCASGRPTRCSPCPSSRSTTPTRSAGP